MILATYIYHGVKKLTMIIAFIIICSVCILLLLHTGFLTHIMNFNSRGFDSLRYNIWKDYISLIITGNTRDFILGAPFANATVVLTRYNSNLHNSFLMLHSKYGIIICIIVVMLQSYAIYYYYKSKNYIILILCLAWIIRMSVDYCNFNSILDILFVIYVFAPFDKDNKLKVEHGCNKSIHQKFY